MVAEFNRFANDIISKFASDAAGLSAGRGVAFVASAGNEEKTALVAASTDITDVTKFHGFSCYNPGLTGSWPLTSTTGIYQTGQAVAILRKGRIWLFTEQAVVQTDTVYCRYGAGSTGAPPYGRVRKDNDSTGAAAVPTARFCTTAAANTLVLVEINLV
jgi:hypothetical protein